MAALFIWYKDISRLCCRVPAAVLKWSPSQIALKLSSDMFDYHTLQIVFKLFR